MLRHPRVVIALALLVLVGFGLVGSGVTGRLDPTTLNVPGTESSKANELLEEHFGSSAPFAILLRGPAAAIERQGPELIRALRRDPKVTTLSPWDDGAVEQLRPSPNEALVLADFHDDIKTAVNDTVPHLNRVLQQQIRPPVRYTQTGYATISRALQDESIDTAEQGELIALPFLLIVLLLVFRSPIAAAIPLCFGAFTVIVSRGVLYLFTYWLNIDAFALTVCSMMGLALGVDYALLMVSRFREELAAGKEPLEAAQLTRRSAGRTTMFAGSTLVLSMLVSLFILPGSLLASLAITLVMVVVLSVGAATILGPTVLALVGSNIDRWRIGPAPGGRSRLMAFVNAALRRPVPVAILIGGIVLVLAAPAVAVKTGPPSPEQLPQDSPARLDAEFIGRQVAPGYEAPFQVIAATKEGTVTDPDNLAALTSFQRRLAKIPGVQVVVGPAEATKGTGRLRQLGNAAFSSEGNIGPVKQLSRLGRELGVAAGGVSQLREGLSEASAGAGLLATGSGRAGKGAQLVAGGLGRAVNGSERALNALHTFAKGAKKLANAQELASVGALKLALGTRSMPNNIRHNGLKLSRELQKELNQEAHIRVPPLEAPAKAAEEQLKAALAQLQGMDVGKSDPNYQAALQAVQAATAALTGTDPVSGQPYAENYAGLPTEITALQARLLADTVLAKKIPTWFTSDIGYWKETNKGAEKLNVGLRKIARGGRKLANGATKLSDAAQTLSKGIVKLSGGATALVKGIARLTGGAEELERSLAEGVPASAPLESGLEEASVQVIAGKHQIKHQVQRLSKATPNIFNSGYFVLSALDGAPPRQRQAAGETIDLRHGGQGANVLVISDHALNSPGSISLNKRLDEAAAAFSEESGMITGVAGGPAQLNDYSHVTRARIPLVVAAITLVTFLVLVVVLRAVLLAALAVGLNLATVGVAFGILTLLSKLPASAPLGGHSYIDAVGATMIFGIVFGLSIDYAVFLLTRMREHYDEHGDNAAAIRFGLDKTARVITGAAAIMMAVFIVFAGASVATVSQLGVGLTVAVILDATVVRIVLLPALMLLLGDRVWWLPKGLARTLPRLNV